MPGERVTLHRYTDEVLVEVIVDDGQGDVRTVSTTFDVVDRDERRISPRGDIPAEHTERIRRRIEESRYSLEEPRHVAGP